MWPPTVQTLLFQVFEQPGASVELLPEALGNVIIHFARLQELLKRSDQVGQVLAVSHTEGVALSDFLALVLRRR